VSADIATPIAIAHHDDSDNSPGTTATASGWGWTFSYGALKGVYTNELHQIENRTICLAM
jgi:heme/copper-type cytochrome/quinol oxidase subunit 2